MSKKKAVLSLLLIAIVLFGVVQPLKIAGAQYYREGAGSYTGVLPIGAKSPIGNLQDFQFAGSDSDQQLGELSFVESVFASDICSSFDV
ncbi:hypothetical protein [Acetivibrio straminisolvens]|uniref:Uncharacterized protein n=1 Tax=Acetivibrio straminisolvens JCM 21531 TaxID=1294263 RepID=W4VDB8_9FIRM|nr:hypothetical protein [Acetivibrio straminisolvens]GAE90788.1 hypothetical protein JCM21531_4427 [Acetivibrio straminisolvens JCM 21531]